MSTPRVGCLLRPYSPYWSDFVAKEFRILVKLQPEGPMSRHLQAVQPDDLLEFRGPIGQYVHDPQPAKCIYIIAQGVAIAPTLPLVRQVLDNEEDMSRLWHLVCARDLQHVYFREEMLEFAQFWNYRSCLHLPHQQCDSSACQEAGHCAQQCPQLRDNLRYKETAKVSRLDADSRTARPHRGWRFKFSKDHRSNRNTIIGHTCHIISKSEQFLTVQMPVSCPRVAVKGDADGKRVPEQSDKGLFKLKGIRLAEVLLKKETWSWQC
ncbi:GM22772 [Drosophila sechellia]|uniref:GM22772 n=1 Tax=Drosophila sechellia TaxID=7238 RepID=B4I704_DROSE|nr:GM22772 [Drosophila sechellia]